MSASSKKVALSRELRELKAKLRVHEMRGRRMAASIKKIEKQIAAEEKRSKKAPKKRVPKIDEWVLDARGRNSIGRIFSINDDTWVHIVWIDGSWTQERLHALPASYRYFSTRAKAADAWDQLNWSKGR